MLSIRLVVPPPSEQAKIIDEADARTQGLRLAAERTQREIDLIREYRTRLIADVVTGKLDVRGVELPPLDEVEVPEEWTEDQDGEDDDLIDEIEAEDADESIRGSAPVLEATAAFLATVHLSAFMASDDLWAEHGARLNRKLTDQHLSLDRATFRSWKLVVEYLSSACAKMMDDASKVEVWSRIYGTPSETVMAMLCEPEVRSVLQRANRIRNDWSGHPGAIGEEKAQQIHDELMGLVYVLRGVFGRSWLGYELIQPEDGRYNSGVYNYKAKRLMGSRSTPFAETQVESIQPLESGALYLFDDVSQTGLKLSPFVLVMPSPEKRANACFIFNRREAGGFRFVSYHFEDESEVEDAFPDVAEALGRMHFFDAEPPE